MRVLNYLEIRTFVRSGSFKIDVNPNIYHHPFYASADISNLDASIKNLAFMNHFTKVSSASANPINNDTLKSLTDINVLAILNPSKPYENIRDVSKTKRLIGRIKNYLRHQPRVSVLPYQTVVLPITISFIHGFNVPELSLYLEDSLVDAGLICTGVHPSRDNRQVTYVSIHNSSSKKIILRDLMKLGKINILQR